MIMMKKLMFFLLVAIFSAGVMTSCSDDDDDAISSTGKSDAGSLRGADGQRLWISSFDGKDVEYDEKGRIESVGNYEFSYNPFTITLIEYGDTTYYTDIRLNGSGYITSMKIQEKGKEYSSTGSVNFSYDGAGHITHFLFSLNEREWDDGEYETFNWSADGTFKWNNNKLITYTEIEKDPEDVFTEVTTYAYGDNEYPNRTRQWTPQELEGEAPEFDFLFCLGYLGVAGDYFPVSSRERESSDDDEDDTYIDATYTYSFNDDGSVYKAGRCYFDYLTR